MTTRAQRQEFPWGVDKDAAILSADVPVHRCEECRFEFTGEEAELARHDAVCRYLGVLSPRELRAIREAYSVSRAEFSRITQIGEASLARWESGSLIQNKALDCYLRLLMIPENFTRCRAGQLLAPRTAGQPRFKVVNIEDWRPAASAFRLRVSAAS